MGNIINDGLSIDSGVDVVVTFPALWAIITLFTMAGTSFAFYVSGFLACRVLKKELKEYIYIPILFAIVGVFLGFFCGAATAVFISAVYRSIPYSVPTMIAIGLGLGQAVIIIYFHLGRADFVHQG